MAFTDSMFLFEIEVEELISFTKSREFCIKGQFADVFSIHLKDPNELKLFLPKRSGKFKTTRKTKVRNSKSPDRSSTVAKVQTGLSVDTLFSNMKKYPLELSLWNKVKPDCKTGSTHIPWSAPYYIYLNKLCRRQRPEPVCVRGDYNIFDELTSKRMAVIKLNVKLSYIKDKMTTPFRSISQENEQIRYPISVLSKKEDRPIIFTEEVGIVKTIYSDQKRRLFRNKNRNILKEDTKVIDDPCNKECVTEFESAKEDSKIYSRRLNSDIVTLVRSDRNLDKNKPLAVIKSKSCSSIDQGNFNMLNYIFGGKPAGPFGNQIYCVEYFTVNNDFADSPKTVESVETASEKSKSSKSDRYKFRICESECPIQKTSTEPGTQSVCSLDLPKAASHLISVKKCASGVCGYRKIRELPTPPDDRILVDLTSGNRDCCDVSEKVEEVVGGIKAKMKFGSDPCFCECECRFGFMKKTTFCNICGGYEHFGDEYAKQPKYDLPFPCPIFHKLADKNKMNMSTSGSDTKTDKKEVSGSKKEKKGGHKQKLAVGESSEFEKETTKKEPKKKKDDETIKKEPKKKKDDETTKKEPKKKKDDETTKKEPKKKKDDETTKKEPKKKKDDRFKFNFGYTAPHIGHSRCLMSCIGTLDMVPKRMGWLWNSENIPGLKFRPSWRPGATNKHVARLLKTAKNPGGSMAKKRKKESQSKTKKSLQRPLLTVHKKDGEYTVNMETMKPFPKPRTLNQYPYEDKPVVTYKIGRTSEENLQRRLKKERAQRRLERLQRDFVQSAFKEMCQEICYKTYQQALGMLPDAEQPDCSCYPAQPGPEDIDLDHSCSCSEDKKLTESDTDSDEWILEFTPPTATFDPTYKPKKITTLDNSTQYTFMDYRVKLLDRFGNPVPRYFIGPDGKRKCSDLGGFWSPEHKWLVINRDGFIGPDEKWAPNVFLGPNGEIVEGEAGKFQAKNGNWLVIGVDGYVDQGKWKFYPNRKGRSEQSEGKKKKLLAAWNKTASNKKEEKPTVTTWSCFGSASPKQLSKMGIVGHGHDKKLLSSTLQDMRAQGENVKIPMPTTVPRSNKSKRKHGATQTHSFYETRTCKHATPSDKGIVAVDGHGNKTYFRWKDSNNRRPKERMTTLTDQGISLSSFHVPCFHSFISSEVMKKQQYERLVALAEDRGGGRGGGTGPTGRTTASAQANYVYVV